jgi:predicted dehydrogenase
MVGYNLRLHRPVEQLMELVHGGDVGDILSTRLWFGYWLPDWRPDTDYRSSYSARAALGGGVLLDAIHEIDLLVWLANGDAFDVVGSVVARFGPLEIDVEDTVAALLRHHDGWVADLTLDYLSRAYRRGIEVVGSKATARFDWARQVVELEGPNGPRSWPATAPVADSYRREAERFLAFVDGAPPVVGGVEAARSVRLADAIRAAAR